MRSGILLRSGLVLAICVPARAQILSRVSLGSGGVQGDNGVGAAAIGADGRFVAFASSATNLVAGDTNASTDVFVRDRAAGTTERVSVDSAEVQATANCDSPSISADGRYVVFHAPASNLVAGDTNDCVDVFVRDRLLGTTERASVSTGGVQGDDDTESATLTSDGRYVAFYGSATNLVAGDTNARADVFVRDRLAGTTERISVDSSGGEGNHHSSGTPSITDDGRFVAFSSLASNLVAGDTNATFDIFLRDRQLGTTERVSVDSGGAEANGSSSTCVISNDARYVAFSSTATNLVAGDTNGVRDIFVRDLVSGTTERVSIHTSGAQGNADSLLPSMSVDGRYVAFSGTASNLVAGDGNVRSDVFVRDRTSGTTVRVSVTTPLGIEGNETSLAPSVSDDGRYIAFASDATNLVAGDTNGFRDIFVRDSDESGFLGFCYPEVAGVRSCPCNNPATSADRGCDSYTTTSTVSGTGGAKLAATGIPNATASNTLVFHVTGAHNPANNSNLHVFWRGTSTLAVGVKSGFGVRCVAGSLRRIYQGGGTGSGGLGSTNAVDFPNSIQMTDAWTASQMPAAGTTLYYYDSFRDQQGPTTCNTANDRFNVSHAGAVTWIP